MSGYYNKGRAWQNLETMTRHRDTRSQKVTQYTCTLAFIFTFNSVDAVSRANSEHVVRICESVFE